MHRHLFFLSIVVLTISCKDPASQQVAPSSEEKFDSASSTPLYPFPQYIEGQIAYVDSAMLGIEMVEYKNGRLIDSGFIDRSRFKELASAFTAVDPNEKKYRQDYEENSFQDLSLNAITFSITAKNPSLPLQRADILLNPDNQSVKYLILKKIDNHNNIGEEKSLMWVHNMNFQINSSSIGPDGKENTSSIKVVWDKPRRN